MAKKRRHRKSEETAIRCEKCGKWHRFDSLEAIGNLSLTIKCDKCGFKYLEYSQQKIEVIGKLLDKDAHYKDLVSAAKFEEANQYLISYMKKQMGITVPSKKSAEKIPFQGKLISIQPRIRLGRSYDQVAHTGLIACRK